MKEGTKFKKLKRKIKDKKSWKDCKDISRLFLVFGYGVMMLTLFTGSMAWLIAGINNTEPDFKAIFIIFCLRQGNPFLQRWEELPSLV